MQYKCIIFDSKIRFKIKLIFISLNQDSYNFLLESRSKWISNTRNNKEQIFLNSGKPSGGTMVIVFFFNKNYIKVE